MKKKMQVILSLAVCASLLLTGCRLNQATRAVRMISKSVNSVATATPVPTATPEPTPKVTKAKLGKSFTIGDWTIQVKKVSTKKQIKASSHYGFKTAKGDRFICIQAKVKNNGKEAAQFLPRIGYENKMITATLHYEGKYEYKPSDMLNYDKDLVASSIKPLDSQTGMIVFEVPKKVANHLGKVTLQIGTTQEYIAYSLK